MRNTLHTSEVYAARKQLEQAAELLTRDGSSVSNTYIPAHEIMQAVELVQEASATLTNTLYDNGSHNEEMIPFYADGDTLAGSNID